MIPHLRRLAVAGVGLLLACTHGEPFPTDNPPTTTPYQPGPPTRLTYNTGPDQDPAWTADGTRLLYSYQDTHRADFDRCLGVLPGTGGSRLAERCVTTDYGQDSVNARESPAMSPGGRVAWVEQAGPVRSLTPSAGAIRVATADPTDPGTVVRSLPFVSDAGSLIQTVTHLRWLSESRLVMVGAEVQYLAFCQGCKTDTLVIGREVLELTLGGGAPVVASVGQTAGATSVWPSADGQAIYYTLAGDGRVLRQELGTGAVTTALDLTPYGIVRDVSVAGPRFVVLAGGNVQFISDPLVGPVQIDSGGPALLVDPGAGDTIVLNPAGLPARHAVLSPAGTRVAAEATTAPGTPPDLWLFEAP